MLTATLWNQPSGLTLHDIRFSKNKDLEIFDFSCTSVNSVFQLFTRNKFECAKKKVEIKLWQKCCFIQKIPVDSCRNRLSCCVHFQILDWILLQQRTFRCSIGFSDVLFIYSITSNFLFSPATLFLTCSDKFSSFTCVRSHLPPWCDLCGAQSICSLGLCPWRSSTTYKICFQILSWVQTY